MISCLSHLVYGIWLWWPKLGHKASVGLLAQYTEPFLQS